MREGIEHWRSGDVFVVRNDRGQFVRWSSLFYRYTFAVMFSVHGTYYSVVGQVWSARPAPSLEAEVKRAVEGQVAFDAGGYDPAEWGGLRVVADSGWEPVPVESGVRLDVVDVRTEARSKRTWKRLSKKQRGSR